MPLLRARHVYLGEGSWLSPGEIEIAGGRVARLRRARGRVPDQVLLPGLVDAHVHLQLEPLRARERDFLRWVRRVMAAAAGRTRAQWVASATSSLRGLLAEGTTAVGEIDSSGFAALALRAVPLAGCCYREVTGFHLGRDEAARLLRQRASAGTRACPAGWSPHAPYSVSPALLQAAAAGGRRLAIHAAEVPEEQEFLRTGRGGFADLLRELGRLPQGHRPAGVGAIRHLERLGVLGPRTLLVHCQELERGDAARIAAAGSSIAVCPGTIAWFGREPPPVPQWLRMGITVGLGTDSRASNTGLSMQQELRLAARFWPGLSPASLLDLATSGGARALHRPGLGRIARGGRADLLVVDSAGDDPRPALESFVHEGAVPAQVWLGGRRCGKPARR